jgi:hypothetical protein
MTTVQVAPVPEQAPPQPAKLEPAAGAAVSVTLVPWGNEAEQVAPQLIPPGLLVTVPWPLPFFVTVSCRWTRAKVAVTVGSPLMVSVQVALVPEQAPPQPVKLEPASGAAVSVTLVPSLKDAEQVAPQVIPPGLLVTVPVPLPAFETVSVPCTCTKVAVTFSSWVTSSNSHVVFVLELTQSPPQPENAQPGAGVSVSVTFEKKSNGAEHVPGQSMPAGSLVTVPLPVTVTLTVHWTL